VKDKKLVVIKTYTEKEIGDQFIFLSLRPFKRGHMVSLVEHKKRKPYGVGKITRAKSPGSFTAKRIE
jgi:hypothetical protein